MSIFVTLHYKRAVLTWAVQFGIFKQEEYMHIMRILRAH